MKPRAAPCRHCPTAHYPPDPGALDMRQWVLSGVCRPEEMLFDCAWTPSRICRGVYDEMLELRALITEDAAEPPKDSKELK